jgi:general L-amino acid transport system substrate-binding protein
MKAGRTFVLAAALAAAAAAASAGQAQTLKAVQDRGTLNCGVSEGLVGFSFKDDAGNWSGLDVDVCRAIAAAIFNDPTKVAFTPLSASARFDALKDKKVDVLARNSTWTLGREEESGVIFTGVNYYDGQAFLVPKARGVESALNLDGSTVCVQAGTTSEQNFIDFFNANNMKYQEIKLDTSTDVMIAYAAGKCDTLTSDESQLFALRLQMKRPGDEAILPEVISKEPLSPVVRADDGQWANLVRWVVFATINAEELGVTQKDLDAAMKSQKPAVRRLVGLDGDFGKGLGLTNAWAANVIKAVGNYGESFERNVGVHSKLGIPRGLNDLWNGGGILYAPPIR